MPARPLGDRQLRDALAAVATHGGISAAAAALGIARPTFQHHVREARRRLGDAPAATTPAAIDLRAALRRPVPLADLADQLDMSPAATRRLLDAERARGVAVIERDGVVQIDAAPDLGSAAGPVAELLTDRHGRLRLGAIGDTHLCSKYERLDCLNDWYDAAAARGVRTVLHAGNWIDGEAPFNKHDITVHGMDAQLRYLARHHPQRAGIETWAITGADHEGWYARREGVDVGRYAERTMRDAGRADWRDMGYMESFIRMTHADSGASSMLCLMHPGGGSAYAISYAPQKIVEGFDGGDKPAVLLIGHYHKASSQLTRNVHAIQTGCFQDQTPFMRQKKLAAHVGGMFLEIELDPRTGAVIECGAAFRNYYVRSYYAGRWSQHGDVTLPPRPAAGAA